jgi:hypothetical protein
MMLAPGDDTVETITRGDRGADQKQEELGEGIHDPISRRSTMTGNPGATPPRER